MVKYKIFSLKEKEDIVALYQQKGWDAVAKKYTASRSTVTHWLSLVRHASASDKHPLARRYLIRPETIAFVKQQHDKHPGFSLEQIRQLTCQHKQKISCTTVWHIIKGR